MKMLDMKNGIITHPGMMFLIAFVLGLVVAYLWANYTTLANPFCAK